MDVSKLDNHRILSIIPFHPLCQPTDRPDQPIIMRFQVARIGSSLSPVSRGFLLDTIDIKIVPKFVLLFHAIYCEIHPLHIHSLSPWIRCPRPPRRVIAPFAHSFTQTTTRPLGHPPIPPHHSTPSILFWVITYVDGCCGAQLKNRSSVHPIFTSGYQSRRRRALIYHPCPRRVNERIYNLHSRWVQEYTLAAQVVVR